MKKIILGQPGQFALAPYIFENLQQCGFEIIDAGYHEKPFSYKNFRQRTHNFLRKTLLNDHMFKHQLKFKNSEEDILEILAQIEGKADYAFVIRPDMYSKRVIKMMKEKAHKTIGYQWDGFKRYPGSMSFVPLFDRYFVFDSTDLNPLNKQLHYITNFYFDTKRLLVNDEAQRNEIFFVGAYIKNRMPSLLNLIAHSTSAGMECNINIFFPDKKKILPYKNTKCINILDRVISYDENLKMVKRCAVVVDMINNIHNGLSFRVFEALCFEKKLITNNPIIRQFDFYNENNIFIYDENNFNKEAFAGFLQQPYVKISDAIKQKYSFTNWIHYVLDLPPYNKISLPEKLR